MIRVELVKLLRRPRTWVTIGLLCALPLVVAIFLAVNHLVPSPGQGPAFLSDILVNRTLYPAAALAMVLPVFLPIAVTVMAGEAVAGEAGAGMLRYLLIRPVGRTRLLVAKLVALIVFVLLAVAIVAVTSYFIGIWILGPPQPGAAPPPPVISATSLSGEALTPVQLILRMGYSIGYISVSMLGVAAIALFLSTLTESPLAATMGALAALVTSGVLVTLDAANMVDPYLPTRYWLAWIDFFREPILWHDIERGFAIQAVYVLVFLGAAWANFATKDITD